MYKHKQSEIIWIIQNNLIVVNAIESFFVFFYI